MSGFNIDAVFSLVRESISILPADLLGFFYLVFTITIGAGIVIFISNRAG